jgi:hypothetical protein
MSSIRDNLDADANAAEKGDPCIQKHPSAKPSTHEGRMISIKPV